MSDFKLSLPVALAVLVGLLATVGLFFLPGLAGLLVGWAIFLAAVALLLGLANLLAVHGRRAARGNAYSLVLLLVVLIVFVLALTDELGFTSDGVTGAFNLLQVPLEGAFAALLAFFLLFAGVRLLPRQRSWTAALFLVVALLVLLGSGQLPFGLEGLFRPVKDVLDTLVIEPGMRGLLIGVALGAITVTLRLLIGLERPYDK
jgi:type IV secretory pathway VirB2 component (pilin)